MTNFKTWLRSTQTETFSTTTQTKNGHHSTDPYFEKGQIHTRCVLRRVFLRQVLCKCFAIPSPIHRQCGYKRQAWFALGGVLFHQGARERIFRFLRSTSPSDISKLLHVISRAVRPVKFETILKYHEWYLCQISRTNHAIICSYYYPQNVCNCHM